jgi:hypothetical protein
MAFKNIGPVTFLTPGSTAFWIYSFSKDMGPQFACADIKLGGHVQRASPVFLADQQRKQLQQNGNATYFVSITNEGPNGGMHNLQGGGLT